MSLVCWAATQQGDTTQVISMYPYTTHTVCLQTALLSPSPYKAWVSHSLVRSAHLLHSLGLTNSQSTSIKHDTHTHSKLHTRTHCYHIQIIFHCTCEHWLAGRVAQCLQQPHCRHHMYSCRYVAATAAHVTHPKVPQPRQQLPTACPLCKQSPGCRLEATAGLQTLCQPADLITHYSCC